MMKRKYMLLIMMILPMSTIAAAEAVKDPWTIVKSWAQAAKERNGKVQYQLLCKDQQNKFRHTLQELNWVTGVSSPSIGTYNISHSGSNSFKVKYQILLQNKNVGNITDTIYVNNGCISQFKYLSPAAVAPVH